MLPCGWLLVLQYTHWLWTMRMVQNLQWMISILKAWGLCKQRKLVELLAAEELWDAATAVGQCVDVEMVEGQDNRDLNLWEGRLRLGHVTSALISILRLGSIGFWVLKAILRSLSISFLWVFLMSTHRYLMISVIKFTENGYLDPQRSLVETDSDWVLNPWVFPQVNLWWSMSYPESWHALAETWGIKKGSIAVDKWRLDICTDM